VAHPLNGLDVDVSGQHVRYGEEGPFLGYFSCCDHLLSLFTSQNQAFITLQLHYYNYSIRNFVGEILFSMSMFTFLQCCDDSFLF